MVRPEIMRIKTFGDEQSQIAEKIQEQYPKISTVSSAVQGVDCIVLGRKQLLQEQLKSALYESLVVNQQPVQSRGVARLGVYLISHALNASGINAFSRSPHELNSLTKLNALAVGAVSTEGEDKNNADNSEEGEQPHSVGEQPHSVKDLYEESSYMRSNRVLFEKNKDELLKLYKGKYILYEDGKVVDKGESRTEVAMRAYEQGGMRELFIELVTDEPFTHSIFTPFSSRAV